MFGNIVAKVRGWLAKLGLLRGIEKVTDMKDVMMTDKMYNNIEKWKQLYMGYYPKWHDVTYQTVDGNSHKRQMRTLGMPKVISAEMANLVFNEKCEISLSDEETHNYVQEVFKNSSFYLQFQNYLEYMFAIGGIVAKVYADKKGVRIGFVNADCFIPTADDGKTVTEGIFINESRKNNKKYTLLEWHRWEKDVYVIRNELYESDGSDLGVKISLDRMYPDLKEEVEIKNLKRSLFVYIKPNLANNVDLTSRLGVSIYSAALDTIQSLDVAFDSFEREFRLGKKRIIVPSSAVRTIVDPQSGQMQRYFDSNDEVYEAMNFDDAAAMNKIHDISVELRVDEHIAAINALLNILSMQTGFSTGSFTFDSQGLKTATEVVSQNSKTYRTRNGHITIIEEALKDLIAVILDVSELYEFYSAPEEYDVSVNFDDSIAEDRNTNADYWIKLKMSGLTSAKMAIMKVLKVTEEEAERILKEIQEEKQAEMPQELDLTSGLE
ncbi:portal protein [Bacillus sp. AFS098217]|uniref:phage portal protein n=1 Tax=unclassified Bacillus (in: firmicutes) TaxID=185979 RepID=UPI000BEE61D3|nr:MULTISPECIES: phage portal protein [unclassified Bacillus (in: firmicutes)]PEB52454.1 portal protein [Bacillus sp. AFS098217]PEU16822.1 portal protein [Bacillus sp. AFS019443]PEU20349.1 portal protein [Bacillus sp. AFS014408]